MAISVLWDMEVFVIMVIEIEGCWNELWGRDAGFVASTSNPEDKMVVPRLAVPGLVVIGGWVLVP